MKSLASTNLRDFQPEKELLWCWRLLSNLATENEKSSWRASVGFWLAWYPFLNSRHCNPFFTEIFGEPRIICASIGTSSTPICWHDPQKADPVRAEETIP